jgi:hypothetical protein
MEMRTGIGRSDWIPVTRVGDDEITTVMGNAKTDKAFMLQSFSGSEQEFVEAQ